MASATAAYRSDVHRNGQAFGPRDGEWIAAATLVEHAALLGPESSQALEMAAAEAARALGDAELARLANREWGSSWSGVDAITLLAVVLQEAGARSLAACVLEASLRALSDTADLSYGRMLAQRARVSYQKEEYELAEDQYTRLDRLGRRLASPELRTRAALGFAALASVRGNHPRYRVQARRALRLAEQSGVEQLRRASRMSCMRCAVTARNWDEALSFGWQLIELARGNAVEEASALVSMGQLLLELGDHTTAQAAFLAVAALALPPRFHLAALGGLARSTAAIDPESDVLDWAVGQIVALRDSVAMRFGYADALLECAIALQSAGRVAECHRLCDEVLSLAHVHGFHELSFRAEALRDAAPSPAPAIQPSPEPARSRRRATIVHSIRALRPDHLPDRVRLAAVAVD